MSEGEGPRDHAGASSLGWAPVASPYLTLDGELARPQIDVAPLESDHLAAS